MSSPGRDRARFGGESRLVERDDEEEMWVWGLYPPPPCDCTPCGLLVATSRHFSHRGNCEKAQAEEELGSGWGLS